jgi:hypothetical protein
MKMENKEESAEGVIDDTLQTVSYKTDSKGQQKLVSGKIWQPVNVVNHQAWQVIEKQVEISKEKVDSGKVSCLHYYMTANQMEPGLLAKYTGLWSWQVRLHLFPFFFKRLRQDTLSKYAEVFKVSEDDLRAGEMKAPVYEG